MELQLVVVIVNSINDECDVLLLEKHVAVLVGRLLAKGALEVWRDP